MIDINQEMILFVPQNLGIDNNGILEYGIQWWGRGRNKEC